MRRELLGLIDAGQADALSPVAREAILSLR
jgi:hypothetical protein